MNRKNVICKVGEQLSSMLLKRKKIGNTELVQHIHSMYIPLDRRLIVLSNSEHIAAAHHGPSYFVVYCLTLVFSHYVLLKV